MGRPLKIAKAQAVVTITATNGTTEVVTTSANFTTLGIIAGMPFVVATNVGNLVAGTTYWILEVLNAGNNSTFTVSETELSANPTYTKFDLGAAGPVTVAATVGLVDYGFSNPDGSNTATNSTSYGVVGGDTALYGKQTLCRVAIGVQGDGIITSDSSSADIYGGGTDFANTLSAGTAIQAVDVNGNPTNLGFVTSIAGYTTEAITDTEETGSFVVTSGDATNFVADQPIVFDVDIGGLTAGTVYWMLSGANTTHFQVAYNLGGGPVLVSNDTVSGNASQDVATLVASASASNPSGTSWVYADDEAGYILRQKGKNKYLVKGSTSGLLSQCLTANVANTALTPNTMNILATYADTSTKYVESLNDYQSEVFPTTVAAGSLVASTVYTIQSVGNTNWTAVGAYANMTGITFTATGAGSGTGTAVLNTVNPDVIATFGTAYAANTYNGQPNPIVTISNS